MLRYRYFRQAASAAVLIFGVAAASAPVQATEGYFQHGFGVVSKALAGAGVAYSQDAMGQSLNPAGLVDVENQLNLGVAAFSPMRNYTGSGAEPQSAAPIGTFDSENELFPIPNFGVSYRLNDASSIGISLYGNGGMNTEWEATPRDSTACPPSGGLGVYCAGKAGVDMSQTFIQPTFAYRISDGLSVGVAPIIAIQAFEAKGLAAFGMFSDSQTNLSNNGHDISYGFGGRFGVQFAPVDSVKIGAAYQMRTYMTEFDKYAGLFAEQGDFDIPPALQVGVSWKPIDAVTLLFDYRRIWYSDIASVGNPGPRDGTDLATRRLGGDNGIGYGWEDVNIFKFGAQWEMNEDWTLRAGYSLGENPIPSSEVLFNIIAPGVIEHHITGGVSYKVSDRSTLNVGAFYAPAASVSGPNPMESGNNIELEMSQFEFSVGWGWKF
jgi:long-chain fatty acid transport protein